jgi:hypothetical protein
MRPILSKLCKVHVGDKFGALKIVSISTQRKNGKRLFNCICDCGKERLASIKNLRRSNNKCRCLGVRYSNLYNRKPPGHASWQAKEKAYKISAKNRNLIWNITSEEFKSICSKDCFYCGSSPKNYNLYIQNDGSVSSCGKKLSKDAVNLQWISCNGVDRRNSLIGYELSNCVSCCSVCNYMKLDTGEGTFLEHCKKIVNFQRKNNG